MPNPKEKESNLFKKDLYAVLEVSENATEKEIVKAYKKKALKYHPDKNQDNPKASELFQEVYEICELLKDAALRAAYDQLRAAKKKADERTQALDGKRKKFKQDLEAREQAADQTKEEDSIDAKRKLEREIDRLRKEGTRLLEEEQERLRKEFKQTAVPEDSIPTSDGGTPRVKLKWSAKKGDPSNGGYCSQNLNDILSCYGQVSALLISSKRNGSAIVEFENTVNVDPGILEENGLKDNPFTLNWLSGKPSEIKKSSFDSSSHNFCANTSFNSVNINANPGFSSVNFVGSEKTFSSSEDTNKDFENLVLRRMRQAEERKKLIEEMQKEDDNKA